MKNRILSLDGLLRTVALLCLVFCATRSNGQLIPSYTFSQQNPATYVPITGGIVAASGTGLTDDRYAVSLPFSFNFDNTNYTSVYLAVNGFISFGTTDPGTAYWLPQSGVSGFSTVSGFDANLASLNSTTELRYQTLGVSPNRVFVAQWKHFGYPGTTALSVSFQVRLSESSNVVAVSYDTCTLTGSSQLSVFVGLRGLTNATYFTRTNSSSNWTSTTASTANTNSVYYTSGNNPPVGLTYTFTPPPACTVPGQPTGLTLTPSLTSMSVGYTPPLPAANKYLVVRTPGNTVLSATPVDGTYYSSGTALGNGTVVYSGTNTTYNNTGLTQNTTYTYTVFAFNDVICVGSSKYNTLLAPSATIQTLGPKAYTWIATSGSGDYTVAANWSPARTGTHPADSLYFKNGGDVTVINMPTQTVNRLCVQNGTKVKLVGSTLTLTDSLQVTAGSRLMINGATLKSATLANMPAYIYGEMCISGSSTWDASNANVHIYGTMIDSCFAASCIVNTAQPGNLVFEAGSNYIHARDGGTVPYAVYNSTSTVAVTGMTNTSPLFHAAQSLGNFTWNCAGQTTAATLGSSISTVNGDFLLQSTNSYVLKIGASNSTMTVNGNFIQNAGTFQVTTSTDKLSMSGNMLLNGGTLDLQGGTGLGVTLVVKGNITQGAGHFITKNGTGTSGIIFNGTTHQVIALGGLFAPMKANYTLNNPTGATLTGAIPVGSGGTNTISAGGWDGTGSFNYDAANTMLYYSSTAAITASTVEWPATNAPSDLTMALTGTAPANRIHMPGNRTVSNAFYPNNGVLILDNYNLTYGTIGGTFYDVNTMIAADSTGMLIRPVGVSGTTAIPYIFPVGNIKGVPEYSPVTVWITGNGTPRNISVKVKPGHHPADTTTNNYLNRYCSIMDDGGSAPAQFKVNFGHLMSDIIGAPVFGVGRWNGTAWMSLSGGETFGYALNSSGYEASLVMDSYVSTAATPLSGDYTGRSIGAHTYSWTGATSNDYQEATNWAPNRIAPDIADILQFNSGNTHTVSNIPSQSISKLIFTNNTTAYFQAASGAGGSSNLTLYSDYDTSTNELRIDNGSALYLNGTVYPLTIQFSNTPVLSKAVIAGRLEINNTTQGNVADFSRCYTTVTTTGVLAAGTTNSTTAIITGNSPNYMVTVNGLYEHKYTTANTSFPNCIWNTGSTILVNGFTNIGLGIFGSGTCYNLVYNCPNQTGNCYFTGMPTVAGTFSVLSTGSGQVGLGGPSGTSPYTYTINNLEQTSGTVLLANGNTSSTQVLNIGGNFSQTGGAMPCTGTGGTSPTINFNGTSGVQNISFYNAAPTGPVNYRVSNNSGINLTGNGTLTGNFNINTNGGLRISSTAANPINTTLTFAYSNANSTLTYDAPGICTTNANIFPATSGPVNLSIAMPNGAVTLPFSRTVTGTLRMSSGDIDMGANTLTLGTSVASPGTMTWTAGFIRLNGGSFTRWFGTSGLPTAAGNNAGFFPIGYNGSNRNVNVYFSTGTALSTGGSLSVTHTPATGLTTGLSVADNVNTITSRSNTSWSFTANGLVLTSATMGIKMTTGDMFTVQSGTSLHVMQASSVVGTHVNGSGTSPNYIAERNGLTLADITTAPLYVGSHTGLGNVYTSITTGNWNNGSTWDLGTAPGAGDVVIISANTNVSVNGANAARYVTVQPGGTLTASTGTLVLDSALVNNGTITLSNATMNLGPAGGGKFAFINNNVLTVNSGNLNVNGYLANNSASSFAQYGGSIMIDGNANGVAANSVSFSASLLGFYSSNLILNGGTITIVDPHASGGSNVLRATTTGTVTASPAHTIIFGDGISTTNGDFYFDTWNSTAGNLVLGNMTVNGTSSVTRTVKAADNFTVGGNVTINNANGVLDPVTYTMYLKGDLTVNAGAKLNASGITYFNKSLSTPAYAPQMVYNYGTIQYGTHNFNVIIVDNNAGGVVMNMGDVSVEYYVNLVSGNLNIGQNNTLDPGTSNTSTFGPNGWVIGKLLLNPSSGNNFSKTFAIGDVNNYTPVVLNGTVSSASSLKVGLVTSDHPAISSSPILPNKSVNRYFTLENAVAGTSFTGTIVANWVPADMDPGTNFSNLTSAFYNSTNTWSTNGTTVPMATYVTVTGFNGIFAGAMQIGEPNPTPLITQQPTAQAVCENSNAVFTVITASTGVSYQWQKLNGASWNNVVNGAPYSGVTTNSLTVTGAVAISGSQYRCRIYNATDTAYSSAATLTVNPLLTPAVTLSVTPNDTICINTNVTFTATPVNGGTAPQYQWFKNNVSLGAPANAATYASTALANNDLITCVMTSNAVCPVVPTATSTGITMTVNPVLTPSVTIAANPGNVICTGTSVTFTATPVNGGTNPSYQWKKNNLNVGTNTATYTDASWANGATIACVITSNALCVTASTATSNTIVMQVSSPVTPTISITANPGATICANTNVTFTATTANGGTTPFYQWKKNGVNTGTNTNTYSSSSLAQGDVISCSLTSSLGCVTAATVNSNNITMTVNPQVTPDVTISVAPNDTICSASSATFSAVITNPGPFVSYIWRVNGSYAGSSSTYATSSLANGDVVTLAISTTPQCATTSADTSNAITMTVNPVVTPSVSIAAAPGNTVCAGTPVIFTATPVNGGTAPAYQWKKNGVNVGTNAPAYTNSALVNGDVITCEMQSNTACPAFALATSNSITMTVNAIVTPSVSISSNPGNPICPGLPVTFTAVAVNGGTTPVFQWKKNGGNIATGATYTTTGLSAGDVITCELTGSNPCASQPAVLSNAITIIVATPVTPSVTITANPGTTLNSGQSVTFTASAVNGGTSPAYQWRKNGVNQPGQTGITYTTSTLANGDVISVRVHSNLYCTIPDTAVSNALTITIKTGVNNVKSVFGALEIFPNPTRGNLVVNGMLKETAGNRAVSIKLLNMQGQELIANEAPEVNGTFNWQVTLPESLANGIYMLRCTYDGQSSVSLVYLQR